VSLWPVVGESGVGKSSLLNCMAALDDWSSGTITHDGVDLGALNETQRAHWRREKLGFVFQAFHVLPHLDVAQNVGLPLLLLKRPDPARVAHMLHAVGLGELGERLPAQLSGGQLQRVAIARALVHRPSLLLADEPTGNPRPHHRRAGDWMCCSNRPRNRRRPGAGDALRSGRRAGPAPGCG